MHDNENRNTAMSLAAAACLAHTGPAHAELTIWQVENNPPDIDRGNEWLTVINTGEDGVFGGYSLATTHSRTATYHIPTMRLDVCDHHRITFSKQTLDNQNDTVKLLKNGTTIYQTPVIKDTCNDDRLWSNPDVSCDSPSAGTGQEPMSEADKDRRIRELEVENAELKVTINILQETLADLALLHPRLTG